MVNGKTYIFIMGDTTMETYDIMLMNGTIICGVSANDLLAYVERGDVAAIVVSGLGEIMYDAYA